MKIRQRSYHDGRLIVNEDFIPLFKKNGLLSPDSIWEIKDESVKAVVPERRTGRFFLKGSNNLQTEFYIKRYWPLPLSKRLKALTSLKWEKHNAFHEWKALMLFHENLLPTLIPVAVGKVGKASFNITLGLKNYKRASELLEEDSGLDPEERLMLIEKIATYAARMHKKGFAHQDLYLVHFFIKLPDMIPFLIDLQRVVIQKRLRRRWAIKDIAQLLFASCLVLSDKEIDHLLNAYSSEVGFDVKQDKRLFKEIKKKVSFIMKRYMRQQKKK